MMTKINWPLLGMLRFFLAFIVLTAHLKWFIPTPETILKFTKFSPIVAVLGFLVISGFSIAASFDAKKNGFYFRRALRIIPIYTLSVAYTTLITLYFGYESMPHDLQKEPQSLFVILGNLIFLQGIVVPSLNSNPIVWTLSIEVFFYTITPLLSTNNKYFLPVLLASALLFVIQRHLGFYYFSQMLFGLNIAFLGWAWLLGFWYFSNRNSTGSIFFVCCLGIIAITINGFFITDFWTITWILVCALMGYGHLVELPFSMVLKKLGDISYPLYLLHIPIFLTLKNFNIVENGLLFSVFAIILCFGVDCLLDNPLKRVIKKAVLKTN